MGEGCEDLTFEGPADWMAIHGLVEEWAAMLGRDPDEMRTPEGFVAAAVAVDALVAATEARVGPVGRGRGGELTRLADGRLAMTARATSWRPDGGAHRHRDERGPPGSRRWAVAVSATDVPFVAAAAVAAAARGEATSRTLRARTPEDAGVVHEPRSFDRVALTWGGPDGRRVADALALGPRRVALPGSGEGGSVGEALVVATEEGDNDFLVLAARRGEGEGGAVGRVELRVARVGAAALFRGTERRRATGAEGGATGDGADGSATPGVVEVGGRVRLDEADDADLTEGVRAILEAAPDDPWPAAPAAAGAGTGAGAATRAAGRARVWDGRRGPSLDAMAIRAFVAGLVDDPHVAAAVAARRGAPDAVHQLKGFARGLAAIATMTRPERLVQLRASRPMLCSKIWNAASRGWQLGGKLALAVVDAGGSPGEAYAALRGLAPATHRWEERARTSLAEAGALDGEIDVLVEVGGYYQAHPKARALRGLEVEMVDAAVTAGLGGLAPAGRLTSALMVRGTVGEVPHGMPDTVDAVIEMVGDVGLGGRAGRDAMTAILLPPGRRLGGLEALDGAYHADARRRGGDDARFEIDLARRRGVPLDRLFPPAPPFRLPRREGSVVQLRDAGALAAEGLEMGHCIGDYTRDVALGRYYAFSLRTPLGRSTVGVELGRKMEVDQVMGARNAPPPEGHERLAVAWCEAARANERAMARAIEDAGLAEGMARRIFLQAGFAPRDLARWRDMRFERLRPLLPPSEGRMGRGEWLRARRAWSRAERAAAARRDLGGSRHGEEDSPHE